MTDTPDSNPVPENDLKKTDKPKEAKKADSVSDPELDGLFDDLADGTEVETFESIKAERDALLQEKSRLVERVHTMQQELLSLTKRLTTQSEEAANALARVQRDVEEKKSFALEKFVKDFLPVLDTFELGINAVTKEQREADPKLDKLVTGFEKVLAGQLSSVFNKFGVKAINPQGEAFDPDKHEAISAQSDPAVEPDIVVNVAQKGYELNGRVIRPAKVVVNQ